ncbi:ABC transporter ATP-binding protein [Pseudomonas typographi]|uniref:ABC transporter ATP-binding protein n=1 Tax=Pseudomonas typographi TaxID=2715964 RepID=UPI001682EAF5|nr:ABC transporter ATP-binding protein [Pseudomonas typographi]MBD1551540.1 ABC transporter ATP-binding protein [Pseudomonas typographi]
MAQPSVVSLRGVSKRYSDKVLSVDNIDLDIAPGEFISLLGPSGCGKTTTLRMIAGFEAPSAGRILIDGQDLTDAPPYGRPVNTVFQDYALFPHLNVSDNVGFGLSLGRRVAAAEARKRVTAMLELVGLADKARARVYELSGGQQQRIAMARALVCQPRVLLLDEPLSALDAHLRQYMQVELKRLQSSLGTTFIMVTHDQTEALSISDRIAVMDKGHIEQVASPDALYDTPHSAFVAGFIGASNLLPGEVLQGGSGSVTVAVGALRFTARAPVPLQPGAAVTVSLRPEDLRLGHAAQQEGSATTHGRILQRLFHGRALRLHISLPGIDSLALDISREAAGQHALQPGDEIPLSILPGAACAFPAPAPAA